MSHSNELRLLREAADLLELLEMLAANSENSEASDVAWGGMQRTLRRIGDSIAEVESALTERSSPARLRDRSEHSETEEETVRPLGNVALHTSASDGDLQSAMRRGRVAGGSSLASRVQLAPTSRQAGGSGIAPVAKAAGAPRERSASPGPTPGTVRELLGSSSDSSRGGRAKKQLRPSDRNGEGAMPKSKIEL